MMTEKRKAIFLDKDGTLIPDVPYNVNPDLVTLEEGVVEGLQLLQQEGYCFVVISNQAGVAKGCFDYRELQKVEQKIDSLLKPAGIKIEKYFFCPHHPEGKVEKYAVACECRKPGPAMLLQAVKELGIDTKQSWMIGDILNDAEAGNRAGCRTILINNGNETEWVSGSYRKPTFVAANFLEASYFIKSNPYTFEVNDNKLAAV